MDISPTAVAIAGRNCAHRPIVHLYCGALPGDVTTGLFDLIVLSEIGYYFDVEDLVRLGSNLVRRLEKSGVLLATHWLGHSEDHLLHGDLVHETLGKLDGIRSEYFERHAGFRIDRWIRV